MEEDKQISLEEMKKIEIGIMKYIDQVCKENHLRYSLMDGSLIGAVRHQGFIPWDDDIDIMMPRPDFEKLKSIMIKQTNKDFLFMDSETQSDYYYPFAKIVDTRTEVKEKNSKKIKDFGVYVDLYIIDAVPANKTKRYFQSKTAFLMKYLSGYYSVEEKQYDTVISKIYKPILNLLVDLLNIKRLMKWHRKLSAKYDWDNTETVAILGTDLCTKRGVYYSKYLFKDYQTTKFEDCEFSIIKQYDPYLKKVFGNYMELPPEEERVTHHFFDYLRYKK